MNNCIKCGKEIPDGELFCRDCSLDDVVGSKSSAPSRKTAVKQDTIRLDPVKAKKPVGLIISLVVVSLMLLGSLVYIYQNHSLVQRAKNQLLSAEVSAEKANNESLSLQDQLNISNDRIIELESQAVELKTTIADLESQLHGQSSQSNQDAYDASAKEQDIQRLTAQADQLSDELNETKAQLETVSGDLQAANDALEEQAQLMEEYDQTISEQEEKIDSLGEKIAALEAENTTYLKKATFMDKFVVFVENDGTNLYHTYDCSRFKKEDFWVFNPSYAKNQGYSECPYCH